MTQGYWSFLPIEMGSRAPPNREFAYNVLATLKPDFAQVIQNALNLRGVQHKSKVKPEEVGITDAILDKLTQFPIKSSKFSISHS